MAAKMTVIPIEAIDEPSMAARSSMDQANLDSLAQSIRDNGLIEPLVLLKTAGDRYEIIAGHRRFIACRMAGLVRVEAVVRDKSAGVHALRIHENIEREELSAADEARYYQALYVELGEDVDKVCAQVKKPREYVERRLLLFCGDETVFGCLQRGALNLGQAEELNRIKDPNERAYYLEYTLKAGATIRQLRIWRDEANGRAEARAHRAEVTAMVDGQPAAPPAPPNIERRVIAAAQPYELLSGTVMRPCKFCRAPHEEFRMLRFFVCVPCADRINQEVGNE